MTVDEALAMAPGGAARFVVEDGGRPVIFADSTVDPDEPTLRNALQPLGAALADLLSRAEEGPDQIVAKSVRAEVEPLLA
jgi:hypothetical protein